MQVLRTSLVPGALQIARHNIHRGSLDLRLFEIGTTFLQAEGKRPDSLEAYEQKTSLLLLLFGNHAPISYSVPGRKVDLLDMKGEVEAILKKFCLDKYRLIYYDTHSALSDKVVNIEIKGTYAGSLGSVKKQVLKAFDIEDDVYVCELNVEALLEAAGATRRVKPPPKFPSVTRDLAFVVEDVLPQVKVEEAIRAQGGPVLKEVTLFDTYVGAQTGAGKKSLAYALEFQSPDKTMTDEEIDRLIARIVQGVERECNGVLRS
jgi:phenylalanyl-tRNA synthetase beta chain